jgi:hypothetical protein
VFGLFTFRVLHPILNVAQNASKRRHSDSGANQHHRFKVENLFGRCAKSAINAKNRLRKRKRKKKKKKRKKKEKQTFPFGAYIMSSQTNPIFFSGFNNICKLCVQSPAS